MQLRRYLSGFGVDPLATGLYDGRRGSDQPLKLPSCFGRVGVAFDAECEPVNDILFFRTRRVFEGANRRSEDDRLGRVGAPPGEHYGGTVMGSRPAPFSFWTGQRFGCHVPSRSSQKARRETNPPSSA